MTNQLRRRSAYFFSQQLLAETRNHKTKVSAQQQCVYEGP